MWLDPIQLLAISLMTSLIALVSGFGWHVADLRRAAGKVHVLLEAVAFSSVAAVVGDTSVRGQ